MLFKFTGDFWDTGSVQAHTAQCELELLPANPAIGFPFRRKKEAPKIEIGENFTLLQLIVAIVY